MNNGRRRMLHASICWALLEGSLLCWAYICIFWPLPLVMFLSNSWPNKHGVPRRLSFLSSGNRAHYLFKTKQKHYIFPTNRCIDAQGMGRRLVGGSAELSCAGSWWPCCEPWCRCNGHDSNACVWLWRMVIGSQILELRVARAVGEIDARRTAICAQ